MGTLLNSPTRLSMKFFYLKYVFIREVVKNYFTQTYLNHSYRGEG